MIAYVVARALFAFQRMIFWEIPFMPARFVWFRAAVSVPFPFLAAAIAMVIGKPCHAALFGSRARGDAGPDSDIDILVEIAPDVRMDVFKYVGIVHSIEDLFPIRVDVSNRLALKPHVKPSAEREAIYAF